MTHQAAVDLKPPPIHVRSLKNSFWTPERDRELIQAIEAEKSWGAIAAEMGKNRSAVSSRINRLKKAGAVVVPSGYRLKQVAISNKARAGKPLSRAATPVDENFQVLGIVGVSALESHHCRFIANDDVSEPLYCGHTVQRGSYCNHHRAIVYHAHDDRMGRR